MAESIRDTEVWEYGRDQGGVRVRGGYDSTYFAYGRAALTQDESLRERRGGLQGTYRGLQLFAEVSGGSGSVFGRHFCDCLEFLHESI